jgi:hypothetical protein
MMIFLFCICVLKSQTQKAARVADCLNDLIWRRKNMRKEIKSKTYKANVRPIMYALETRALT